MADAQTAEGLAADGESLPASVQPQQQNDVAKKKRKVYEAGGVIACDGKVVLRLTDEQHWIFPKGKLKKHESPVQAAIREAVEETGLEVEVIGDAGEFLLRQEGKKRRFAFYLMRATGKTWDWAHHEGRDTFLISPDKVAGMLRKKGYGDLWERCRGHVSAICAGNLESPNASGDEIEGGGEDAGPKSG